jgi:subtilisin family serine protease
MSENIKAIQEKFVFTSTEGELTDAALNNTFSHGTKCAGIALAEKNEQGIVGVAYGCKFLPVWLDMRGGEDLIIKCFEKVGKIAHVISFSNSPLPENMKSGNNKSFLSEKLSEVARFGGPTGKGCVVCVSAGNNQVPINGKIEEDGFVFHLDNGNPQKLDKGETIVNLYAANPDVIAVTASTSTGTIAAYTNFGNEVSVCAPSSNWNPAKGMTKLTAAGIYTTASSDGDQVDGNGSYSDNFGGTSAAAPLVAGIAALVLSANNNLPAAIVKKILEVTADKIDFENSGKEKYDDQGHSQYYGYGKVNAAKAVQLAVQLKNKNSDGTSTSVAGYMQQIANLGK